MEKPTNDAISKYLFFIDKKQTDFETFISEFKEAAAESIFTALINTPELIFSGATLEKIKQMPASQIRILVDSSVAPKLVQEQIELIYDAIRTRNSAAFMVNGHEFACVHNTPDALSKFKAESYKNKEKQAEAPEQTEDDYVDPKEYFNPDTGKAFYINRTKVDPKKFIDQLMHALFEKIKEDLLEQPELIVKGAGLEFAQEVNKLPAGALKEMLVQKMVHNAYLHYAKEVIDLLNSDNAVSIPFGDNLYTAVDFTKTKQVEQIADMAGLTIEELTGVPQNEDRVIRHDEDEDEPYQPKSPLKGNKRFS